MTNARFDPFDGHRIPTAPRKKSKKPKIPDWGFNARYPGTCVLCKTPFAKGVYVRTVRVDGTNCAVHPACGAAHLVGVSSDKARQEALRAQHREWFSGS